jgi:hypothetical protein
MERYKEVILKFHTRVLVDDQWQEATLCMIGYEDTQSDYDPKYLLLCEHENSKKAIALLRESITALSYL